MCLKVLISYYRDIYLDMFIAALLAIAKKQKQLTWSSTDEWIMKNEVYVHCGILFSYEEK